MVTLVVCLQLKFVNILRNLIDIVLIHELQVKSHKWMLADGGAPVINPPVPVVGHNASAGEFNEQILRLMQSLGIDQQKTQEVAYHDFVLLKYLVSYDLVTWLLQIKTLFRLSCTFIVMHKVLVLH